MKLFETPKHPSVEITWNVVNANTGQRLNKEPLTEEAAHALARQLQESDSKTPLIVKSNRATLMG